jgi:ribosomal protein S13
MPLLIDIDTIIGIGKTDADVPMTIIHCAGAHNHFIVTELFEEVLSKLVEIAAVKMVHIS